MTLAYYALFAERLSRTVAEETEGELEPAGMVVLDPTTGDGLLWDHRQEAWAYGPETVNEFLFSPRNLDRFRPVNRAEAERVTLVITGSEPLPDEDTIRWIFQWKGQPPDLDPE